MPAVLAGDGRAPVGPARPDPAAEGRHLHHLADAGRADDVDRRPADDPRRGGVVTGGTGVVVGHVLEEPGHAVEPDASPGVGVAPPHPARGRERRSAGEGGRLGGGDVGDVRRGGDGWRVGRRGGSIGGDARPRPRSTLPRRERDGQASATPARVTPRWAARRSASPSMAARSALVSRPQGSTTTVSRPFAGPRPPRGRDLAVAQHRARTTEHPPQVLPAAARRPPAPRGRAAGRRGRRGRGGGSPGRRRRPSVAPSVVEVVGQDVAGVGLPLPLGRPARQPAHRDLHRVVGPVGPDLLLRRVEELGHVADRAPGEEPQVPPDHVEPGIGLVGQPPVPVGAEALDAPQHRGRRVRRRARARPAGRPGGTAARRCGWPGTACSPAGTARRGRR